jgi:5'-methylthioadenosine phosphorylase
MIGIIGGSGLYAMRELGTPRAHTVTTPFGAPSSPLMTGTLHGREVAFLARHGLQHQLLPGEINFRANIWALKSLGVRTVIGVSAVGSLREEIRPGDLALPSQYLDFTRGTRAASFFGGGLVAHISSAHPTCRATAALIARVARAGTVALHEDKTYACVEGPRLGTRAESLFLRAAGADIVGMTNVPEAFLALEAQLGYCTIALATDYDSWLEDPAQHASAEQILQLFRSNLGRVQQLLAATVAEYREDESRPCRQALRGALLTPREQLNAAQRALLEFLQT